ncbi:MAG: hypothetical protein H0U29_01725, partial [Acidimicrobiia bacterium]|nr:hypothetical protein [Acidimicrobiia bacterium]
LDRGDGRRAFRRFTDAEVSEVLGPRTVDGAADSARAAEGPPPAGVGEPGPVAEPEPTPGSDPVPGDGDATGQTPPAPPEAPAR